MRVGTFYFCGLLLIALFGVLVEVCPATVIDDDLHAIAPELRFWISLYVAACGAYLAALTAVTSDSRCRRWLFILLVGISMRALIVHLPPVLENDYHRYLWDGAVTSYGFNPWEFSPEQCKDGYSLYPGPNPTPKSARLKHLALLSRRNHQTLYWINHGELRSIYPPVAQASFATSYLIEPFSVRAWRGVLLVFDVATLALIIMLLREVGRPAEWALVYWWCPLVAIEAINRCHMDLVLLPFVLGAVLLALRRRHAWSMLVLGLAVGVKFWPIVLAPLLLRSIWGQPRRLAIALGVLLLVSTPMFLAPLSGGVDEHAGLIAYGKSWSNNSALYESGVMLLTPIGKAIGVPGMGHPVTRYTMALAALGLVAFLSVWPMRDATDLVTRCAWATAGLFLLSPTQFPWYWLWALPLLCVRPLRWALLYAALLPLYHLNERLGMTWVIWVQHLPVLALALYEFRLLITELSGETDLESTIEDTAEAT